MTFRKSKKKHLSRNVKSGDRGIGGRGRWADVVVLQRSLRKCVSEEGSTLSVITELKG